MNPDPVSVNANAPAPAVADAGKIEANAGTGFAVIGIAHPADAPPPGEGFTTVTVAVPADAMSAAAIAAVNCVALIKFVGRGAPFQFADDVPTNPVPLTVNVNAAAPLV